MLALLALSLLAADDGLMCTGVPSNLKLTSVTAPTGTFGFVDAGSVHTTGPIVGSGAATADLGTRAAGNSALWLAVGPTVSNYALSSSSIGDTTINATSGQSVTFAISNVSIGGASSTTFSYPAVNVTGTTVPANGIYNRAAGVCTFAAGSTGQWEINSSSELYPLSHGALGDSSTRISGLFLQGALDSTSTIVGTNITASGPNGYTASGSGIFQVSASNTALQCYGNSTDAASATALKLASNIALTAGTDRYIATLYNDAVTTPRARVFTDGTYQNLATVGTAASGTGITAVYSGAVRTFLHKVTVINTALAAASTSDVTLAVTPANSRIVRVVADVTQVFTGGVLSAVTVQCGNTAGGTQYLLANSVFTAQNTWGDVVAEMGAGVVDSTRADFGTSSAGVPGAITVQCRFTCTGANCSAATQGSVTFYVEGVTY